MLILAGSSRGGTGGEACAAPWRPRSQLHRTWSVKREQIRQTTQDRERRESQSLTVRVKSRSLRQRRTSRRGRVRVCVRLGPDDAVNQRGVADVQYQDGGGGRTRERCCGRRGEREADVTTGSRSSNVTTQIRHSS